MSLAYSIAAFSPPPPAMLMPSSINCWKLLICSPYSLLTAARLTYRLKSLLTKLLGHVGGQLAVQPGRLLGDHLGHVLARGHDGIVLPVDEIGVLAVQRRPVSWPDSDLRLLRSSSVSRPSRNSLYE